MWYKIDFTKLVVQLLPPILRSRLLTALLRVMIVPLRYLYSLFSVLKGTVDDRLNITGNVMYLEKALNDAFYLKDRQIYIETAEEETGRHFYFAHEQQKARTLYLEGKGNGVQLWCIGESSAIVNFVVMVPTFLCTSLDKHEDKFSGVNLQKIKNLLNIYKPAGRTFSIELYDYE